MIGRGMDKIEQHWISDSYRIALDWPMTVKVPMLAIALISPRGVGFEKATAALPLDCQLARGAKLSVIDADPNHPIFAWGKSVELPDSQSIIVEVDENNILNRIEEFAAQTRFVISDPEATAVKIALLSFSQAHLAVIPMQ